MFTIGKLANHAKVKIPTIRYYESISLLEEAARSPGNQRRYTQQHLDQLNFIKHARNLGFSIESVRELLELSQNPKHLCGEADKIARTQLHEVRIKIKKLKSLERELTRMTQHDRSHVDKCAVIQTLSDHGLCNSEH